jgi:hypothetical protein
MFKLQVLHVFQTAFLALIETRAALPPNTIPNATPTADFASSGCIPALVICGEGTKCSYELLIIEDVQGHAQAVMQVTISIFRAQWHATWN